MLERIHRTTNNKSTKTYIPNLDPKQPDSYFNLNQTSTKPITNLENAFNLNTNLKSNGQKNNNATSHTSTSPNLNFAAFEKEFRNDNMFDAFDSHFIKKEKSTPNKGNVDAFGGTSTTTTTSAEFVANFDDVFKNNFEDEFSNMNIASNGNSENGNKVSDKNYNFDAFSRYAEKPTTDRSWNNNESNNGFTAMFGVSNKNILDKNAFKMGDDKVNDKCVADFSKGDNFDKDLEEALKRSLVDQ